ncbi:MAG TPA: hypothetical protein VE055_03350 [Gaiellaceae bacterium]|nr:hypothetical protein [Gaiellaceae bacterium]
MALLAQRARTDDDRLASALLAAAIDQAESACDDVVGLLEASDAAYSRAQLGLQQAASQDTIGLDEL